MSEAPCRQPPLKCMFDIVHKDLEPWLLDVGTRLSPKKLPRMTTV